MEIDFLRFRSLHSLLVGPTSPENSQEVAGEAGPWDPATLRTAIRFVGVSGWNALGLEGDFEQDSPEALEALEALAWYEDQLSIATRHPESRGAAEAGVDRRSLAISVPESGPLDRYGWEDGEGFPLLRAIADGRLKPSFKRSLSRQRNNDQKLIGALAVALIGAPDFPKYTDPPNLRLLAQDIEIWAKSRGLKELGEDTVWARLDAALKLVGPKES